MPTARHADLYPTAAIAAVDPRALGSLILVSLLGLALILGAGAELLRGP